MTQQPLQALEQAARNSLADAYGHALSDDEWATAKAQLLALARALRDDFLARPQEERAA